MSYDLTGYYLCQILVNPSTFLWWISYFFPGQWRYFSTVFSMHWCHSSSRVCTRLSFHGKPTISRLVFGVLDIHPHRFVLVNGFSGHITLLIFRWYRFSFFHWLFLHLLTILFGFWIFSCRYWILHHSLVGFCFDLLAALKWQILLTSGWIASFCWLHCNILQLVSFG